MRKSPYLLEDCPIWKMQNGYHLQGFSRAYDRTGFHIPELRIFLDAGMATWKRPKHIFITHGHLDHTAALPIILPREEKVSIYCLDSFNLFLQNYLDACQKLNDTNPEVKYLNSNIHWHTFEMKSGEFTIKTASKEFLVKIIPCVHIVPSVGYCFYELRRKLKTQYRGKKSAEIKKLRKEGIVVTEIQRIPLLGYITDTNLDFSNGYKIDVPILLIECTSLDENGEQEAYKRGHLHLNSLLKLVKTYPETLFVPIHFSLKHKKAEIIKTIKNLKLSNIQPKFL